MANSSRLASSHLLLPFLLLLFGCRGTGPGGARLKRWHLVLLVVGSELLAGGSEGSAGHVSVRSLAERGPSLRIRLRVLMDLDGGVDYDLPLRLIMMSEATS